MNAFGRTVSALLIALTSFSAISQRAREQGVTDTEIRIGNLMPYRGNLEVFGAIGKAEAAYFELINERGGINGRKVRFISYDDKFNPAAALDRHQWRARCGMAEPISLAGCGICEVPTQKCPV